MVELHSGFKLLGNISGAGSYKAEGMIDPTSNQDYVTKIYADTISGAQANYLLLSGANANQTINVGNQLISGAGIMTKTISGQNLLISGGQISVGRAMQEAPTGFIYAGSLNPTFGESFQSAILAGEGRSPSVANNTAIICDTITPVETMTGTNLAAAGIFRCFSKHSAGNIAGVYGLQGLAYHQPSGTGTCTKLAALEFVAYQRSTAAAATLTNLYGINIEYGIHPSASFDDGLITSSATGLRLDLDTSDSSLATSTIPVVNGILIELPRGYGDITTGYNGINISNSTNTYFGTTPYYRNISIDNGNTGAGASITTASQIYLNQQTKGGTNWQIYSVGGNNYFGNGIHEFVGTISGQGIIASGNISGAGIISSGTISGANVILSGDLTAANVLSNGYVSCPNLELTNQTGYSRIQSYSNHPIWINPLGNDTIIFNNTTISGGNLVVDKSISGAQIFSSAGFTGTGAYTNFTISGGLIIAAS